MQMQMEDKAWSLVSFSISMYFIAKEVSLNKPDSLIRLLYLKSLFHRWPVLLS